MNKYLIIGRNILRSKACIVGAENKEFAREIFSKKFPDLIVYGVHDFDKLNIYCDLTDEEEEILIEKMEHYLPKIGF